MLKNLLIAACTTLLIVGCGSKDATQADEGKTPAQVAADAKAVDEAKLEQLVADYEVAIAQVKADIDELAPKIKAAGTEAVGDLMSMGDDAKDSAADSLEELKQENKALTKKLADLTAKMNAYAAELASRAGGDGGQG